MLKSKNIKFYSKDYKKIKKLIYQSFPIEEITPSLFLCNLYTIFRKGFKFTAYYFDNNFIGFTFTAEKYNFLTLIYFAISKEQRNKGFGSEILNDITKKYNNKKIVLYIEELDQNKKDIKLRIKRLKFYERNNFQLTKFYVKEYDYYYQVMTKDGELDVQNYKKMIKHIKIFENRKKLYNSIGNKESIK